MKFGPIGSSDGVRAGSRVTSMHCKAVNEKRS